MLQAKKRFWGSKPGFDMGDVLHIGVNVAFALAIYAMTDVWSLLPLAVILVLLSKWRVLAVQPRFWLPNVKANLVDIVVGISTIGLIHQASYSWIAFLWTGLYVVWLLFLKPQTQEFWVGMQSFWSQLIGLLMLFMIPTFIKVPLAVCVLSWLVAWAAARHFFSNYEEPHYRTLSLMWGFLVSQIVWVGLHWLQYHVVFGLKIAVLPVLIAVIMIGLGSVYHSYKKGTLNRGVLVENGLFIGALIVALIVTAGWTPKF